MFLFYRPGDPGRSGWVASDSWRLEPMEDAHCADREEDVQGYVVNDT
jgi:hypothetical protein